MGLCDELLIQTTKQTTTIKTSHKHAEEVRPSQYGLGLILGFLSISSNFSVCMAQR
jgi:hypothetical protein